MLKDQMDLSVFCGHLCQSCKIAMQQLNSPLNPPFSSSYGGAAMNTHPITNKLIFYGTRISLMNLS